LGLGRRKAAVEAPSKTQELVIRPGTNSSLCPEPCGRFVIIISLSPVALS
jgi:hypothetical protein